MRRSLLVSTLLFLGLGVSPALAGDYAPPSLGGEVQGDTVTIDGSGCEAGETVTVEGPTGPKTTTADAEGEFAVGLDTPSSGDSITVTATCGEVVQTVAIPLGAAGTTPTTSAAGAANVASSAGSGSLPRTGDDMTVPVGGIGAALIAAGALVVYASKRRTKSSSV